MQNNISNKKPQDIIDGLSDSVINALFAQLQGVNLQELLYKDLLKATLDATYEHYKSLISNGL